MTNPLNREIAEFIDVQELLDGEITAEDLAAIDEGLAQLERGEGIPWEIARVEIEKKYLSR